MYCKNCGTQIADNVKFCPNCGADNSVNVNQNPDNGYQAQGGAYSAPRNQGNVNYGAGNSYAGPNPVYQRTPSVGFGDAIKLFFTNYVNFSDRARRSEFWYAFLFTFLVGLVAGFIPFLGYVVWIAFLIPQISIGVRRLHDIGKSGLYYLFCLIPIAGPIILLVWFCTDGEQKDNQWGKNPYSPY